MGNEIKDKYVKCPLCGMYNYPEEWSKEEYEAIGKRAKDYKRSNNAKQRR